MAKVKVLESFVDVHTKKLHPVGEVFEANEERIAEIQSVNVNLIELVEFAKKTKKKAGDN